MTFLRYTSTAFTRILHEDINIYNNFEDQSNLSGPHFQIHNTAFTRIQQEDFDRHNNLGDQSKISVAYLPAMTFSNLAASSSSFMSVLSPLTMSANLVLMPVATTPEPQVKNFAPAS